MLRWFPRFQVATTCFSCSPPDLNLLVTNFIFPIHVKYPLPPGDSSNAVNKYYYYYYYNIYFIFSSVSEMLGLRKCFTCVRKFRTALPQINNNTVNYVSSSVKILRVWWSSWLAHSKSIFTANNISTFFFKGDPFANFSHAASDWTKTEISNKNLILCVCLQRHLQFLSALNTMQR